MCDMERLDDTASGLPISEHSCLTLKPYYCERIYLIVIGYVHYEITKSLRAPFTVLHRPVEVDFDAPSCSQHYFSVH